MNSHNNIFVIVPTYNEGQNIGTLIHKLMSLRLNLFVLIVDDASPDGTGNLVEELAPQYPNKIFLIRREKKDGLGHAYKAGLAFALAKGADIVVQMDADLSHDPQKVPELIGGLNEADLVLGSRYVPYGKIVNWRWHRRLLSLFGNIYARTILRSPVRDLTAGFKAFKASVIKTIKVESITSEGYVFNIELTTQILKMGYRVKEIPITFTERRKGKSKISRKLIWEAIWRVWLLRKI